MTVRDSELTGMTPVEYQATLAGAVQRTSAHLDQLRSSPIAAARASLDQLQADVDQLWWLVCRSRPGVRLVVRDNQAHFMPADPSGPDLPA